VLGGLDNRQGRSLKEGIRLNRKTTMFAVCALAIASSSAWAQDPRVEISGTAGWTFSDGVSGDPVTVVGVGTFNSVTPQNAFSWGARLGLLVNRHVEVGFLFDQQSTKLEIGGTRTVEVGDLSVRNYHGYGAYNFGDSGATVRPYVLGGLGATEFGSVAVNSGGVKHDIGGQTKFSTTWAAGVKVFPSRNFGIRLEGRWTPTYIKSDAAGWWCDPLWGCYVVSSAQYSNQIELSGGFTLRF
jgi:opacity protein-like surface antigen